MDSLGTIHHVLVWHQENGTPSRDAAGITVFNSPLELDPVQFNSFSSILQATTLWMIDSSRAVTVSSLTHSLAVGQPTNPERFVCGFFIIRGAVEDALKQAANLDLSGLGAYSLDADAAAAVEAHTTITVAPVVGLDASLLAIWAKAPDSTRPHPLPADLILDVITGVHRWTRDLQRSNLLLDTGRINVRFDTWHVENGQRVNGRRTAGRLVGIGTYRTLGRPLEEAVELQQFTVSANLIFESARQNHLECAQGPANCPRLTASPEYYDDPRNTLFA